MLGIWRVHNFQLFDAIMNMYGYTFQKPLHFGLRNYQNRYILVYVNVKLVHFSLRTSQIGTYQFTSISNQYNSVYLNSPLPGPASARNRYLVSRQLGFLNARFAWFLNALRRLVRSLDGFSKPLSSQNNLPNYKARAKRPRRVLRRGRIQHWPSTSWTHNFSWC